MAHEFRTSILNLSGLRLYSTTVVTTAMTGQFAPSGMTGQFITTAQTGQFAPSGMTGQFITSAQTGTFISRGETGSAFYPRFGNPAGFLTSAQAGGISSINVTGQIISGAISITGIQGIGVSISGVSVVISGQSANFVDLTSDQVIAGNKIFSTDIKISGTSADLDIFNSGSDHAIIASGYSTGYYETNIINLFTGANSSSDLVASSSSDETSKYIDVGINSDYYAGGFIGNSGDAYLYNLGNDLYIGAASSGRKLYLFAGHDMTGLNQSNLADISITKSGIGISISSPRYTLHVNGSGNFSSGLFVSGIPVVTGDVIRRSETGIFYPSSKIGTPNEQHNWPLVFNVTDAILSGSSNLGWDNNTQTLEIGITGITYPTNPILVMFSGDTYYQVNIQNLSTGLNAQSDYVLTANIGNDTSYFVDLGINNSNFKNTGYGFYGPLDGFLYVNGGNLNLGTSTSGVVTFHITGFQTGNKVLDITSSGINLYSGKAVYVNGINITGNLLSSGRISGQNIILSTVGSNLVLSGSGLFPAITMQAQTVDIVQSQNPNDVDIFNKVVAGRGMLHADNVLGSAYVFGPAMWDKQMALIGPGSFQNVTVFGHATPITLGTVTHTGSAFHGYATNFQTAVTPSSSAGISFSGANYYLGTGDLRSGSRNGFFYSTHFMLPDTTGAYITGLQGAANGQPTGFRFFAGLTDQSLATTLSQNISTGNYIGILAVRATGNIAGQSNQFDNTWKIASADNSLRFLISSLPFDSGNYRFSLYAPPSPNVTGIYWKLENLTTNTVDTGIAFSRLPRVGTALRPAIGLFSASGVKNLLHYSTYISD